VSTDGTYGKRQRYGCIDPTTGESHRFVPELPRLVVASGTCEAAWPETIVVDSTEATSGAHPAAARWARHAGRGAGTSG